MPIYCFQTFNPKLLLLVVEDFKCYQGYKSIDGLYSLFLLMFLLDMLNKITKYVKTINTCRIRSKSNQLWYFTTKPRTLGITCFELQAHSYLSQIIKSLQDASCSNISCIYRTRIFWIVDQRPSLRYKKVFATRFGQQLSLFNSIG